MLPPQPSTGKSLISAVSQRALFQTSLLHTPPGCPPGVPKAPLLARYWPQNESSPETAATVLVGTLRSAEALLPICT